MGLCDWGYVSDCGWGRSYHLDVNLSNGAEQIVSVYSDRDGPGKSDSGISGF